MNQEMNRKTPFKKCSCGSVWEKRDFFIDDDEIETIGMTFMPREHSPDLYFFFNHEKCGSTLAMKSDDFADLIKEPIPEIDMAGEKGCPGHCTSIDRLEKCENECRNAPFRRILLERLKKKKI